VNFFGYLVVEAIEVGIMTGFLSLDELVIKGATRLPAAIGMSFYRRTLLLG